MYLPTFKPAGSGRPLVFLHGLGGNADSFDAQFAQFSVAWHCIAWNMPGYGGSPLPAEFTWQSLSAALARLLDHLSLPRAILIGHSMGGMVAQKYLESHEAAGVVLMSSVPPQGLWAAALGLAFQKPGLMGDLNRLLGGGRVAFDTLREAMFAQPVETADLARWYKRMQPESHRAIWDMTLFNLPLKSRMRPAPMLVLGAEHDHLIPPSQTEMTARHYGVEAEIFEGMGHGLMLERDWARVAERILDWLP